MRSVNQRTLPKISCLLRCVACCVAQKGIEDHLAARGKGGGKAFRSHFLELWDHFVREAAASEALFDGFVLSKVLDLAMAMSWCVMLKTMFHT